MLLSKATYKSGQWKQSKSTKEQLAYSKFFFFYSKIIEDRIEKASVRDLFHFLLIV